MGGQVISFVVVTVVILASAYTCQLSFVGVVGAYLPDCLVLFIMSLSCIVGKLDQNLWLCVVALATFVPQG